MQASQGASYNSIIVSPDTWDLISTARELRAAVTDIDRYLVRTDKPKMACDLETTSHVEGWFPEPYIMPRGRMGSASLISLATCPELKESGRTRFDLAAGRQYLIQCTRIPEQDVRDALHALLPRALILGQNFKYDWKFLYLHYGLYLTRIRDLMLMSQRMNAGRLKGHGLGALLKDCFRYQITRFQELTGCRTFEEFEDWKHRNQVSDWAGALSGDQCDYGAKDVALLFPLFDAMRERLNKGIQDRRFHPLLTERIKMESENIPAYAMMEIVGCPFDREHHEREVLPWIHAKQVEAEQAVGAYFTVTETRATGRGKSKVIWEETRPINIGSWQQVKKALWDAGIKVEGTDEKTLKRVQRLHPGIQWILQAKKAKSLLSKFGENLWEMVYPDGRFHPSVFQVGSEENSIKTGRSSYSRPNLQQIPQRENLFGERKAYKVFRRLMKPSRPGNVIGSFDYSTIEPRATAQETGDEALISELNKGKDADLHSLTGKAMLDLDYLPPRGTDERDVIGKICNLAMGYMIGPRALSLYMYDMTGGKVQWPVDVSKERIARYFNTYRGVKRRMDEIERRIKRAMSASDTLAYWAKGRPIYIEYTSSGGHEEFVLTEEEEELARTAPHVLSKWYKAIDETGKKCQNLYFRKQGKILREAYNYTIQGLCADILKLAIKRVHQTIMDNGWQDTVLLWGAIHDEICVECPIGMVRPVSRVIKEAMVWAGEQFIHVVPVIVNGSWGRHWGDCK